MDTIDKKMHERPILSLLRGNELTAMQKAGVWTGLILTGCAIAVFVVLIVQASRAGSARGIVMASSLILFAVGLLYFFLARVNNPRRAWIFLYISVPLAVAAFIVSLYLDKGATAPARDMEQARQTENIYDSRNM